MLAAHNLMDNNGTTENHSWTSVGNMHNVSERPNQLNDFKTIKVCVKSNMALLLIPDAITALLNG